MDNNAPTTLSLNVHLKLNIAGITSSNYSDTWKFEKGVDGDDEDRMLLKLSELVLRRSKLSRDDKKSVARAFTDGIWIRIHQEFEKDQGSECEGFVICENHSSLSVIDDKIILLCDNVTAYSFANIEKVYEFEVSDRGKHFCELKLK